MNIIIQVSDAVYARLLSGTTRIQGTLALVNSQEGNFHAHNKTWRPKPGTQYMRLPHGRISVSDNDVRMHLCISRDEYIDAPQAILGESMDACSFVETITDDNLNTI